MKDENTVKLITDTLNSSMKKFIGDSVNENTVYEMKTHMIDVLKSLKNIALLPSPLPEIQVSVNGNEATYSFFDPKTKEQISLDTWIGRSIEGFYE